MTHDDDDGLSSLRTLEILLQKGLSVHTVCSSSVDG